jgi:prepilin peptidase CpaA
MAAEILVLCVLPGLLLVAAVQDMVCFTIPNDLLIALLFGFAVFMMTAGLKAPGIGAHLVAGGIGFGLGLTLFAFNVVGGGDVKLFAMAALWLGLQDLAAYAVFTGILGCFLSLAMMAMRRLALPPFLLHTWLLRLWDPQVGLPYGLALVGGLWAVLPHSEILRLALAAR